MEGTGAGIVILVRSLPQGSAGIGVVLLVLAVSILALVDGTAKHMSADGYPVLQVAWARFFFQAMVTMDRAGQSGARSNPRSAATLRRGSCRSMTRKTIPQMTTPATRGGPRPTMKYSKSIKLNYIH